MPIAANSVTVRSWAKGRAVELWVTTHAVVNQQKFQTEFTSIRNDGAKLCLVTSGEQTDRENIGFVDAVVEGELPWAVFNAMEATGIDDLRKVGFVASDIASLKAARRAGVAVTVGVVPEAERASLLPAEPDAIIAPDRFYEYDQVNHSSQRLYRQAFMLNPGPVTTTDRVQRALSSPDLCHREPEYDALVRRIRSKLLKLAEVGEEWSTALLAGSGTAAVEAAVRSAVRPGKTLLVCKNGVYGERIHSIADRHGHRTVTVESAWTERIEPSAVAEALANNPDIDAVALVHHETTTGLLNPVEEIATIVRGRGALLVLDAVSSFGGEELDVSKIDFLTCSSNKCLHGQPGGSFVILSPQAQNRARAVPQRSVYFDLPAYLDAQAKSTVPFTPAIPIWFSFEAALDELFDEGPGTRLRRYRERVVRLDSLTQQLGLEQLLPPELRSSSVRSIKLPQGVAFADLHREMKRRGYIIYAGQGPLAKEIFRLCTLGAVELPALDGLAEDLASVLTDIRSKESVGA